jgi:hypothetical protein
MKDYTLKLIKLEEDIWHCYIEQLRRSCSGRIRVDFLESYHTAPYAENFSDVSASIRRHVESFAKEKTNEYEFKS